MVRNIRCMEQNQTMLLLTAMMLTMLNDDIDDIIEQIMFRAFGKVMIGITRVRYGTDQTTSKMSFYACVDKDTMTGKEVKVCDY